MSRWPVFVLAGVLALAAGLGIAQLRTSLVERISGAASAGSAPTAAEDELVARLLAPPFSPTGKEQGVRLVRGALPADPKVDAPLPPGARLIGSVVRTSAGAPTTVSVIMDAPGTSTDIVAFYESAFTALGWKPMPDRGPAPGGFQPSAQPTSKTFCKGEAPPWVNLTVFAKDNGPNDVRLNHQLQAEGFGGGGPCSQQGFGPQPYVSKLPALRAPADVQMRFGGGMSSSNDRQTSETTAVTTRGAAELEQHFAAQLVAAGWTRTGGSAAGPVAWSGWRVPGEGDWSGLLLVIETAQDRRVLSVRAEAASALR